MKGFTPTLPPQWKIYPPGPIVVDGAMWDEDLFGGGWEGYAIWIDGGKGISIFQCSLVEVCDEFTKDGILEHDHRRLMRDFVDTPQQVQAWIDRAVKVAARVVELDKEMVD